VQDCAIRACLCPSALAVTASGIARRHWQPELRLGESVRDSESGGYERSAERRLIVLYDTNAVDRPRIST
jgi:hypothetical protein